MSAQSEREERYREAFAAVWSVEGCASLAMSLADQERADMARLARWFIAEDGTLQEFVDCLEKPNRWQKEIHAARSLADATRDWEGS